MPLPGGRAARSARTVSPAVGGRRATPSQPPSVTTDTCLGQQAHHPLEAIEGPCQQEGRIGDNRFAEGRIGIDLLTHGSQHLLKCAKKLACLLQSGFGILTLFRSHHRPAAMDRFGAGHREKTRHPIGPCQRIRDVAFRIGDQDQSQALIAMNPGPGRIERGLGPLQDLYRLISSLDRRFPFALRFERPSSRNRRHKPPQAPVPGLRHSAGVQSAATSPHRSARG